MDGTRAIAFVRYGQRFQNCRLTFIEHRYPEIRPRTREDAILDGEIVVMDAGRPSFAKLREREHRGDPIRIDCLARTTPATYVVFDVLFVGGREVKSRPLLERKAILQDLVIVDGHVVLSDFIPTRGVDYYDAVLAPGLEGIIAKRATSRYKPGTRRWDWVKIEKKTTLDCVVCGITAGEAERSDTFGSPILGAYHEGRLVHIELGRDGILRGGPPGDLRAAPRDPGLPAPSTRSPRSWTPAWPSGPARRSSRRSTSSSSRRTAASERRRSRASGRTRTRGTARSHSPSERSRARLRTSGSLLRRSGLPVGIDDVLQVTHDPAGARVARGVPEDGAARRGRDGRNRSEGPEGEEPQVRPLHGPPDFGSPR